MELTKHRVILRAASQFLWVPWGGQGVETSPLSIQTEGTLSLPAVSHRLVLPSGQSVRQPFLLHKDMNQQRLQT